MSNNKSSDDAVKTVYQIIGALLVLVVNFAGTVGGIMYLWNVIFG